MRKKRIVNGLLAGALVVPLLLPSSHAEALQSDCNSGNLNDKWCLWNNTNYQLQPFVETMVSVTLATDALYSSYWVRPGALSGHSSVTQRTLAGVLVGCTLSNYGSNNNSRRAGRHTVNTSNVC
ncbi:MAG: hypothetical protein F2873_00110 [Actinobacteria bacterium]|uniref:Unannotated protein n=1 Tax=freshwater metagenome TaxID=449393 RepID=A0A6J7M2X0_9ZZZZ|nr:hypothetical protein [Actinomycetota bacterium]MSX78664.1 hypothetical protein [Actinomycetota bacterium]